jgi:hypothetical protein
MVTPQRYQPPPSVYKTSHNKSTSQEVSHSQASQHISAQIKTTTQFIKMKTIALVKTLRQYSLPSALEGDIEGYLTDVLDQMDLL